MNRYRNPFKSVEGTLKGHNISSPEITGYWAAEVWVAAPTAVQIMGAPDSSPKPLSPKP